MTVAAELPWQRLHDVDWISEKVLVWATLLGRAGEALSEAERQIRDLPAGDDVRRDVAEAAQLVAIVEADLRPLSVFLGASDG